MDTQRDLDSDHRENLRTMGKPAYVKDSTKHLSSYDVRYRLNAVYTGDKGPKTKNLYTTTIGNLENTLNEPNRIIVLLSE